MKKQHIILSVLAALVAFALYLKLQLDREVIAAAETPDSPSVQGTGINYTIKEEILNPIKLEVWKPNT